MEIKPNVVQGEYQGWSFELLNILFIYERYSMCEKLKRSRERARHKKCAFSCFNALKAAVADRDEKAKMKWSPNAHIYFIRNGIESWIEIDHDTECLHVLRLAAAVCEYFNMDQIKQLYDARASSLWTICVQAQGKRETWKFSFFTTRALALLHCVHFALKRG